MIVSNALESQVSKTVLDRRRWKRRNETPSLETGSSRMGEDISPCLFELRVSRDGLLTDLASRSSSRSEGGGNNK